MTGWLINKFYPGREQLKSKMAALFESGLMEKLEKIEYQEYKDRKPGRQTFNLEEPSFSLNLEDIQGIIAILFTGYIVSIIAFLIELILSKRTLPSENTTKLLQYDEIIIPGPVFKRQT